MKPQVAECKHPPVIETLLGLCGDGQAHFEEMSTSMAPRTSYTASQGCYSGDTVLSATNTRNACRHD